MKYDPSIELRRQYKTLLSGIVMKGKQIPVINLAKITTKPPYILIFGGTAENNSTKRKYSDNVSINVNVHTYFQGDYGGEYINDLIVDEIIQRRFAEIGSYGETDNYNIVTCNYSIEESARTMTETSVHIIQQITFNHFIEQKN